MTRVLVIDDEAPILRALRINLAARDYEVTTAADGASGLAAMARQRPDVLILDLGLPDMDGTEVIRGVRGWTSTPIIVLSAWGQENQKVAALDAGADDYVTKPFGMDELLARLRAAVRRAARPRRAGSGHPDFTVDLAAKRVTAAAATFGSPRPSGSCWRCWSATTGWSPSASCSGGVGAAVPDRGQLPAGVRRAPAPEAGARPVPAALPAHRARHGLPLHPERAGGRGSALRRRSPGPGWAAPRGTSQSGPGAARSPGCRSSSRP